MNELEMQCIKWKASYFENDADLIYQDEGRGSLFEQVDKCIELIYFKYLRVSILYRGVHRVEKYFVTKEGMREALLNAIVHRDINHIACFYCFLYYFLIIHTVPPDLHKPRHQ